MQLLKPTDTLPDSPPRGQLTILRDRLFGAFDAARRGFIERRRGLTEALGRHLRANSLVRVRRDRISIGIEVGDLGLERLEPADVGA